VSKMFGQYRVERLLGQGGMGEVYEAIHPQIQRRAAIKTLSSQLSSNPTLVTRFLNEARAVNIVSHPSLVNVYEFGQLEDGTPYFVMEYLEGETLHSRLRSVGGHGVDPVQAMQIIRQITSGLAAAHAKGIIHRDLKPANIMLVPDPETPSGERVKILDFGIAKILETDGDDQRLTNTDSLLGTPTYMSPEQCRSAREVTDRSDVYSLGVIALEPVTGNQPFRGRNDIDTIMRHKMLVPPPIRDIQPAAPVELEQLVQRMLSKSPGDRPTAAEVKQCISQILRTTSVTSLGPATPSSSSLPTVERVEANSDSDRTVTAGSSDAPTRAAMIPATRVQSASAKIAAAEDGNFNRISLRIGSRMGIFLLIGAAVLALIVALVIL
jgi:serine/threonine protein kinase